MSKTQQLITEHINIWTSAILAKSGVGRGSSKKRELYGIKKLRELILELAVRGKLVPQDPRDEPASVLLERIAVEKAELVKQGKLKKSKALPEVAEDEKPFDLPDGWEWVRLSSSYDVRDGTHDSPKYQSSGYPLVTSKNLATGRLNLTDIKYISENDHKKICERSTVDRGDVLFAMIGTIGNPVIVDIDEEISIKNVALFKPTNTLLNNMQFLCIQLLVASKSLKNNAAGGVQKFASLGMLRKQVVTLPPLSEQQRIVAKVDELMALCNQLEQQTEASIDAHATLVETLLTTLTDSADADELAQSWARVAEHFDTLFTTDKSINALKQTILQLAVMGKLVRQNPEDEPASVLLDKIDTEKARLVKEKRIKKQKPLPSIRADEKSFELPLGWEWVKFGELSEFINGDRSKNYPNKNEYVESGIPWINTGHIEPNGTLSTTEMNFITTDKFDTLRGGKIEKNDLVYCLRGATFGKTAFVTPYEQGAIASSLMIIRPYNKKTNTFIFKYLISPLGRSQIFRFDNGSAQPNLSANSVMLYSFPCPPLAEQHRIVAKVDELMIICDQLKDKLQQSRQTQVHLTDALVDQALV